MDTVKLGNELEDIVHDYKKRRRMLIKYSVFAGIVIIAGIIASTLLGMKDLMSCIFGMGIGLFLGTMQAFRLNQGVLADSIMAKTESKEGDTNNDGKNKNNS